jgi:hypothetical protein
MKQFSVRDAVLVLALSMALTGIYVLAYWFARAFAAP